MKKLLSVTGLLVAATVAFFVSRSDESEAANHVGQQRSKQVSMDEIDHSAWDVLLRKYVDRDGYVNYTAWHASSADRQALSRYLSELSKGDPQSRGSKNSQLAFWINAYNAVTIHGILQEYPTSSIRNHTAKIVGYNIWKDLQLYVGGRGYSLEQIEHEVLRKMGEPRIHFAIVCASIGCPRLMNEAYTPKKVQEQLELNSKDFFSRSQNFRHDARGQRFHLSSIMKWFGKDFGNNQAAQLRTIAGWLPDQASRAAAERAAVSVSFQDYDWNLNDQKSRRVTRR